LLAEAGIDRLRAKGLALTSLIIELTDAWLVPLGFAVATPRDPQRRGSHVAVAHPDAEPISRALIERGVIPDFRGPDRLRLGPAPIGTRFVDVWDAMDRLRKLVESGEHERMPPASRRVT
jgi:kynureninase